MEIVPTSVGAVSRAWDEQHLDLAAAAVQVGDAPTSGFSAPVAGSAGRFARAWERYLRELAAESEGRADALRSTIADVLATDEAVAADTLALRAHLREVR